MKERWKQIKGYNGAYYVSNFGRIKTKDYSYKIRFRNGVTGEQYKKGRIMAQSTYHNGYKKITLCNNGVHKYCLVHRLVAETFIPNPNNYKFVNHKDGDKTNNCVDNLEWCTAEYNVYHAMHELPNRAITSCICIDTGKFYKTLTEAAKDTGAHRSAISMVISGKRKKAGGLRWKIADGSHQYKRAKI